MSTNHHQPVTLEITVISAEGLKSNSSCLFLQRIRPFVILSTDPPTSQRPIKGVQQSHMYRTKVDQEGGANPTWGDKFHLPLETTFFSRIHSSIYLQIFSKRLLRGKAQLGWCRIPATDIIEGFRPAGSVRHLSYRVLAPDGSRGDGIVNLSTRLVGFNCGLAASCYSDKLSETYFPVTGISPTATIGIPVTLFPTLGGKL